MYDILNKLPTCSSANKLFQRSMDILESSNPSQSSYLRTLINFQSKCMKHLISSQSKMPPDFSVIVDKWIKVLSSACQSYENSDDVRLAVANSISENAEEVLLDPGNKFGFKSVDAWIVVFTLLCDEEVDIRKVASTAIHLVSSEVGKEKGYPSVDTRALQQAALTLILTHGRRHTDACRHALQNLARSQSKEVPISVTEVYDQDGKTTKTKSQHIHKLPGLFDRSETNTYLDPVEVSRIGTIGLSVLDDFLEERLPVNNIESQQKILDGFHVN